MSLSSLELGGSAPYPIGTTWDGRGLNVAVFSEAAERVELCLFDGQGRETDRLALPDRTGDMWHGYVTGVAPGQRYGLRAYGAYDPGRGMRFNPAKLLFDPYAKAVGRDLIRDDALLGYDPSDPGVDLSLSATDSAPFAPLGAVIDPAFTWGDDRPVRRPLQDSVIYELHVKGFTERHPDIPPDLRGTFAGLAHPAAIDYLTRLGVNAVELLPVQYRVSEDFLLARGLSNYWGYNTLGFVAPDPRLAAAVDPAGTVTEFKSMVAALHAADIAVFLDVVYNHTAEGNQLGPTLSFRGLDNRAYYHLADDPRYTADVTGTGNSFNLGHPRCLQLVADSLRYWVSEMHVDGFRFDLAPELARQFHKFDRLSPFFELLMQDPVLQGVPLMAEPWDVGEGGYQVGQFPVNWSEWNGQFRDTTRRFWRGDPQQAAQLATRLAGSSDLYGDDGRRPSASINLITVHDGFTLADLVSFDRKHNEANGENNRDGTDANDSWNCGAEGPTSDPDIQDLRRQQQRNLLFTLLLSQGVPLLQAGDEFGRSQAGNNNAYCQDNEITWLDWRQTDEFHDLVEFTIRLLRLRASEPAFRRRAFFTGLPDGSGLKDVYWLSSTGQEMTGQNWAAGWAKSLAMIVDGDDLPGGPADGWLLALNASDMALTFALPNLVLARHLRIEVDTSVRQPAELGPAGLSVAAHSAVAVRLARHR
jgi:glycogen operon protein